MAPQQHSSAKTSRAQVPALHRALLRAGVWREYDTNADIGGGKYDLATDCLAEYQVGNVVYDPYNRPPEFNAAALRVIETGTTTATVANVLNVIAEAKVRSEVIELAAKAVAPSRVAYFSIYEGDRSGVGKKTRDGWQEHRRLASYVEEIEQHFEVVKMAVVEGLRVIAAYRSQRRS